MGNDKEWIINLLKERNVFQRRLGVASLVTKAFIDKKLNAPIIVGGTAVALYTNSAYGTVDVDMIAANDGFIYELMDELGFIREGKDFYHPVAEVYIEFPSSQLSEKDPLIVEYIVPSTNLPIYVISLENVILDRLCSFKATGDQDSREWALRMMAGMYSEIDWSFLHRSAHSLGILKEAEDLQREIKRYWDKFTELTKTKLKEDID